MIIVSKFLGGGLSYDLAEINTFGLNGVLAIPHRLAQIKRHLILTRCLL